MKAIAEITKDCLELPASERLKLARILLDLTEVDRDYSPEVEAAWDKEICARMEAVKNGTAGSVSAEKVFDDLERLFPS